MISADLYRNVGNSVEDATHAVDALLAGIDPHSIEPDSLHVIILTCRSLLVRIRQERQKHN